MKIIHILLGKANPNSMNGVNKVVHYLAKNQKLLEHDSEVWGITNTPHVIRHKPTYPLRLFKSSSFRFMLSKELKQAVNALEPGVVIHFHSVFIPEIFAISRRLAQKGIPWVLTPHGGYNSNSLSQNKIFKAIYIKLFENNLVRGAKIIHAIGRAEVSSIKKRFKVQKVVLIPNGQELGDLAFTTGFVERKTRPVFGFCGRLASNHKGLDLMIAGFSEYRKNGGEGQLWIIGDGPDRENLEAMCDELGVSDVVKFLGPKFREDKLNLLRHMDVFVHTSRWDVIPTAVLEASGMKLPLILSDETNMTSFVQRWGCGLILEKNNPDEIAKAMGLMQNLFKKDGLNEMGKNSRLMVETEFQWPKIATNLVDNAYKPE